MLRDLRIVKNGRIFQFLPKVRVLFFIIIFLFSRRPCSCSAFYNVLICFHFCMWTPHDLLLERILTTMKIFLLFFSLHYPTPVFMRKISFTFHISKLSIVKLECSACTTSLETLQELFFLPSKHLALSVDH